MLAAPPRDDAALVKRQGERRWPATKEGCGGDGAVGDALRCLEVAAVLLEDDGLVSQEHRYCRRVRLEPAEDRVNRSDRKGRGATLDQTVHNRLNLPDFHRAGSRGVHHTRALSKPSSWSGRSPKEAEHIPGATTDDVQGTLPRFRTLDRGDRPRRVSLGSVELAGAARIVDNPERGTAPVDTPERRNDVEIIAARVAQDD